MPETIDIDDCYKIAPLQMSEAQKQEAIDLFETDIFYMTEELNDLLNKDFNIPKNQITGKHIYKFRRLNKLLSDVIDAANDLHDFAEKTASKDAN